MSQLERFQSRRKLSAHKDWVIKYLKQGYQYPVTLEIDPTNRCPLNCPHCVWSEYRSVKHDALKSGVLIRVVEEAAGLGVKSFIWTGGGEPLSNPATLAGIFFADQLGIKNAMFTTGVLLTKRAADYLTSSLSWIRFHLDGATAKSYAKLHQVPESLFQQVIDNIRYFNRRRKAAESKTFAGIGTVALADNLAEAGDLARLTKDLGLDFFQYKHDLTQMRNPVYLNWWDQTVVPLLDSLSHELEDSNFKIQFSRGLDYGSPDNSLSCHIRNMITSITADGRVSLCKSLRDKETVSLGNVNNASLREIFDGEKSRQLQRTINPLNCGVFPCPNKEANLLLQDLVSTRNLDDLNFTSSGTDNEDFI